jgi:predicted permease
VLAPGGDTTATVAAVVLKTTVMPALAFLLAVVAGLSRDATYAVTVLAALPTAQNIFLYAQRFGAGLTVARDAIFLSTLACVPVLLVITVLFTR